MAFHERDYYKDSGGGGGEFLQRMLRWLNASFPIGTYLGIRVRVHVTFFIVLGIFLLTGGNPMWTIRASALLFLSVLLHEFGHCLACRAVGGQADDILMWPLGGLAMCAPPRRPWPEFVTVACGPIVNVVIGLACFIALLVMYGSATPVTFNPFQLFANPYGVGPIGWLLADLFAVNYILLLFNLALVFYPFDGGRLVQIALWTKLGYHRSLFFATTFGMVGAVLVGLLGLAFGRLMLVFIAGFGFFTCYQQKKMLRAGATGVFGGEAPDDGEAWKRGADESTGRVSAQARRDAKAAERERAQVTEREQQIDAILDKVHREGIQGLTRKEKKLLQDATERRK